MARRKKGRNISGWLILDKPQGVTSTHAVARIKRLFDARKVGHAGTLDPLATGILPIALGEATKTVSYAMDDEKAYEFTVRWGIETNTDDAEGEAVRESAARPSATEVAAILPGFIGEIEQVPPRFSAIKINGNRAYDLARDGEEIEMAPRTVVIDTLEIVDAPDEDHMTIRAVCGKGTYVRSLARDMGRLLGCFGHIAALRRTRVGPFDIADSVSFEVLEAAAEDDGAAAEPTTTARDNLLAPVESALTAIEQLNVSSSDAERLARGQPVIMRGRDAPVFVGSGYATHRGRLVALVDCEQATLRPIRVFNLGS